MIGMNARSENGRWLCVPTVPDYRLVLAKCGSKMVVFVGVNPSIGIPNNLDRTLMRIDKIVTANQCDGWAMLNLYPQKSTSPQLLHVNQDEDLTEQNFRMIDKVLRHVSMRQFETYVCAAWGDLIQRRSYLKKSIWRLYEIAGKYKVKWFRIGDLTKKGNPRHPLYASDIKLKSFDVSEYVDQLR